MELQGKIIRVLPERSGENARGKWKVGEFVLETHDQFQRKMVFSVFGEDRLQRFAIKEAQEVLVAFDIDAHEYNGRWFNSIRAYDVRPVDPASVTYNNSAPYQAQPAAAPAAAPAADPFPPQEETVDDLPF